MLERAGKFGAKDCLLVKLGKPNQDTRFDVPCIWSKPLSTMENAGIRTQFVALEKGNVLILTRQTST